MKRKMHYKNTFRCFLPHRIYIVEKSKLALYKEVIAYYDIRDSDNVDSKNMAFSQLLLFLSRNTIWSKQGKKTAFRQVLIYHGLY